MARNNPEAGDFEEFVQSNDIIEIVEIIDLVEYNNGRLIRMGRPLFSYTSTAYSFVSLIVFTEAGNFGK